MHDGARCLVTPECIRRVMDSVSACGTGAAAIPMTDTIKRVNDREQAVENPEPGLSARHADTAGLHPAAASSGL